MRDNIPPDAGKNTPTAEHLSAEADQHYRQGDYITARELHAQALAIREQVLGVDHLDTARSMHALGTTLIELSDYVAAQDLLEQSLAIRERTLGTEHPDTAQCLNDLGAVRLYQGDNAGALHLTEQALALREQMLGSDHPDTIESLNNLAVTVNRLGDRTQAIALHELALERCARALGDEHRRTAETLTSLAVRLAGDKRTRARARTLYERALGISERVFGSTHPTTAQIMSNLAAVLTDLGEYGAARGLLERSFALHEQTLGAKHLRTAYVLTNLADLDYTQRNYPAARSRFERVLIIQEQALGAWHPETVQTLRKLVSVLGDLSSQGDDAAMTTAMPFYQWLTALEGANGMVSSESPAILGAWMDPAKAAEELHTLVARLDAEQHRPPPSDADHAALRHTAALQQQAEARFVAGDYAGAQELLEQAVDIREQVQGRAHMDLVEPLRRLEATMEAQGRSSGVLSIRQRIADIHIEALGEGHPLTLQALTSLMLLQEYEYGPGASAPLGEHIVRITEQYLGADAPHTHLIRDSIDRLRQVQPQAADTGDEPRHSRSERREAALAQHDPFEEQVLAGVDAVNWHDLQHAYGAADDVPGLLRMLLAEDPDVREDALEQLYGNIWHQGTVYEASAYAVPFLLRILADERTPDRLSVLHLLSSLATGNSYIDVHHREGDTHFDWRKLLAEQGRELETERAKELGWVRAANEAVAQGIELFFTLLQDEDEDDELRQQALATLVPLHGHAGVIVPRLQAMLVDSVDRSLRPGIVRALHGLMDDSALSQQFLADLLQGDEPENVTFIAAVALITRARERAPETAVAIVLDALRELGGLRGDRADWWETQRRFYPEWDDEGALQFGLVALRALGGERARTALLQALPLIHDPEDAERLAGMLLELVFNEGRTLEKSTAMSLDNETGRWKIDYWGTAPQSERRPGELNPAQRSVLPALIAHNPLWERESNLLHLYGLPISRDALRTFLNPTG